MKEDEGKLHGHLGDPIPSGGQIWRKLVPRGPVFWTGTFSQTLTLSSGDITKPQKPHLPLKSCQWNYIRPVFALEAVVQPSWANWSACSVTLEGKWSHVSNKFNHLTLVPKLLQRGKTNSPRVFSWLCGQSASTTYLSCLWGNLCLPHSFQPSYGTSIHWPLPYLILLPWSSPLLLCTLDDSGHSTYPSQR